MNNHKITMVIIIPLQLIIRTIIIIIINNNHYQDFIILSITRRRMGNAAESGWMEMYVLQYNKRTSGMP